MTDPLDTLLYAIVLVLSVLGTRGTPTLSLGFPSFASFAGIGARRDERSITKPYSGIRVQNDSLRMVYYNMQTVAVVELGPGKLLLNCELLEVYDPEDANQLLQDLTPVNRPLQIKFSEMMTLMSQCQQLESPLSTSTSMAVPTARVRNQGSRGGSGVTVTAYEQRNHEGEPTTARAAAQATGNGGLLANNPFTLFSGIIPGTKWCGTGDLADNYHDLGREKTMDKCCRTHDLCPLKIRAYSNRYNLTNNSLYSNENTSPATVSNFEVMTVLQNIRGAGTKKNKGQLATITYETLRYLENTPCKTQSTESIRTCLQKLSPFKLNKNEKLMLINHPPQTALEIQLMIDEGEERLTQEQVDEILQIMNEYFPQPESPVEAME